MDPVKELGKLLDEAGVKVAFGLYQQGRLPRVFEMMVAGKSWEEIGKAIGWDPDAARRHFYAESKAGAMLIEAERERQISAEDHTLEGDQVYENNELLDAAVCYIRQGSGFSMDSPEWPWKDAAGNPVGFKPVDYSIAADDETKQRIRALVKAGALIAAEIDRLRLGGA